MRELLKFGLSGFLVFLVLGVVIDNSTGVFLLFTYTAVFIFVLCCAAVFKLIKHLYRMAKSEKGKEQEYKWEEPQDDTFDYRHGNDQPKFDAIDYYRKFGYYRQNGPNQKKKVYTETYRDKNQSSSGRKQEPQEDGYYYSERLKRPVYRETFKSRPDSPTPRAAVDSEFEEIKATSFQDHKAAGDHGESLVCRELSSLLYSESLFSYIQTNNMVVNNRNFEIDFMLLVDQVGLVLVEVKYYSGQVKCTDDENWQQINGQGTVVKQRNASKQVLRARSLLRQLLMQRNLNRWPIHAVVLFAHENATILRGLPPKRPQTEILKLKGLPGWIESQSKNLAVKFTKEDHEEIKQALKSFEREYEKTA